MKCKVIKIQLQLGDRTLELTAEEAKQVQAELNKLFTPEETTLQKLQRQWDKDAPPCYPHIFYSTPVTVPDPGPTLPSTPMVPWCGGSTMVRDTGLKNYDKTSIA